MSAFSLFLVYRSFSIFVFLLTCLVFCGFETANTVSNRQDDEDDDESVDRNDLDDG